MDFAVKPDQPLWGQPNFSYWNGLRYFWQVSGFRSNNIIVFLHGFGANSAHWRRNAAFFANEGFCVYGIDLVGFGMSEQPGLRQFQPLDNKIWSDQLISFLKEVIQVKSSQKVVLIANSLGSLIALTAKAYEPNLITTFIAAPLPDPVLMTQPVSTHSRLLKSILRTITKLVIYLLPIDLFLPIIVRTKILDISLKSAYFGKIFKYKQLRKIIAKPAQRPTASASLRSMCIGMSLRPFQITAPALLDKLDKSSCQKSFLLLWGSCDRFVPIKLGEQISSQYPWIDFKVIASSGHCPHDESPEVFNRTVMDWLNRILNQF